MYQSSTYKWGSRTPLLQFVHMKGSASFKYWNITEECYCSTFSLKIHMIAFLICMICLHFPSDWRRSCPYQKHAPRSWVALFGSDWDVWNKKKDCQQYNTRDTFRLQNFSPQSLTVNDAIKILELQGWWLSAQLLIFSGSYSTPLFNYGRNQMNCKWNKFSPEHFHFINTCFRFWEHISSIVSFTDIVSNYYFLLKKENYLITPKETQKKVALNTVFLRLENKNSARSTELCL